MKRITWLCLVAVFGLLGGPGTAREIIPLSRDWFFLNRDLEQAAAPGLDLCGWERVTVPHDWAIKGPFDMTIDAQYVQVSEDDDTQKKLRTGRTGALPIFGVGWYRHSLPISAQDRGKRIFVEFDGAMSSARIYLNGEYVAEWPYGYSSFSVELTDRIDFEGENLLAVRLENLPESSRWYSGAGLYRDVRLVKSSRLRIPQWGVFVTTPDIDDSRAVVQVQTEIDRGGDPTRKVEIVSRICSPQGETLAESRSGVDLEKSAVCRQRLILRNPLLWDLDSPNLYRMVSMVLVDGEEVDRTETRFGCRTVTLDRESGTVCLNGRNLKLKGVCLHHDLGPLGAAVNYRATQRQIEMMKQMGANSIRTSHNPPSPQQVAICDSMGMLMIVEAFDEWRVGKNRNGYHRFFDEWAERDIRNMVLRDRNSPSVFMWSLGNEIRDQRIPEGRETARFLAGVCKRYDPTRPVTAGFNRSAEAIEYGLTDEVDVVGLNYHAHRYAQIHREHPDYLLYGSETASTVSSRGVYKFPVKENNRPWHEDYQLSSYDMESTSWATVPDREFLAQDTCPYLLGEYVWTGFDYLGEPSPYNEGTPAKSSYFGIVDLGGLKKDRYYLYQSRWSDKPVLHLLPHWNWEDREGKNVPVFCYTNYPKAELFVNGVSMGVRQRDTTDKFHRYRLMWSDVVYHPGKIEVVAYDHADRPAARKEIRTASAPYGIRMTADRSLIRADGRDLSFVTVEVVDREGNPCPRASNLLFFEARGAGRLKALCNGDPTDQTSFSAPYMRAFSGKLVAVVESTDEAGGIELIASGAMLRSDTLRIQTLGSGVSTPRSVLPDSIGRTLQTIAASIVSQTDYTFTGLADGAVYGSVSEIPQRAEVRLTSPYNEWEYQNSLICFGLEQLGNRDYTAAKIDLLRDSYAFFARQRELGIKRTPYPLFFEMKDLWYCGLAANVVDQYARTSDKRLEPLIRHFERHIFEVQPRLADGTLIRVDKGRRVVQSDDAYMAVIFLMRLWQTTGRDRYLEEAVEQVLLYNHYLLDPVDGLYHHVWYCDENRPGGKYWGRGTGWMVLAMAELLEKMPQDHAARPRLLSDFNRCMAAVAKLQMPSGLWRQVLDVDSFEETSCSAMFVYTLAKGINEQWIDSRYKESVYRGWQGLLSKLTPQNQIKGVCVGTHFSDDLNYYLNRRTVDNDRHVLGSFLLAGSEILKMETRGSEE